MLIIFKIYFYVFLIVNIYQLIGKTYEWDKYFCISP